MLGLYNTQKLLDEVLDSEVILSLEEAEKYCKEFQELLHLRDWTIQIKFTPQGQMEAARDTMAMISYNDCHKWAIIELATPGTYSNEFRPKHNMLMSLMHELIHLHFAEFMPREDSAIWSQAECAINQLSWAILALYTSNEGEIKDVRKTEEQEAGT